MCRVTTRLRAAVDDVYLDTTWQEHFKKSGSGVATKSAGNMSLFDPNDEGKLQGTNQIHDRVKLKDRYSAAVTVESPSLVPAQDWLLEQHDSNDVLVPPVFAKATAPVTATCLGRIRLITPDAPGDIQHVVLQLPDGMHYLEGQSLSVVPPGVDPKTNKAHAPRLYSIASTRYGDLANGATVSLCVRRATYVDPNTGLEDESKAGICSNYLCNLVAGQAVAVAGPVGKTMLLPSNPDLDLIMVATGTGIAPFRGFLHRLFVEATVASHLFTGTAWLILGVPTTGGLLYPTEFAHMQQREAAAGTNRLQIDYAISREMTNAAGGKLYVQDVLREKSAELWQRLQGGAHIYFCGLKGMMPGILEALEQVAAERGVDWATKLKEFKANGQWHVEVY
jgi:ferredoxin--NADP+ reductase